MAYRDQFAGWAKEVAWGTPVTPRTQFARIERGSFVKPRHPSDAVARLGRATPEARFSKVASADVHLITRLPYVGVGKVLEQLFGDATDAGAGPSYTHTFKVLDKDTSDIKGLTVEAHLDLDSGTESWLAEGAKVTRGLFSIAANEEPMFEFDAVAERAVQAAKTASPTYTAEANLVTPVQVGVTINSVAYVLRSLSIEFDKNVMGDDAVLGSSYVAEPVDAPGYRSVKFTAEIRDWSKTLVDLYIAGTSVPIVVTCTGPTNHSLVFTMPKAVLLGEPPDAEDGGVLSWTLEAECLYDATDSALKIVETNTVATT